ncbi:MAG: DUF2007 domain-containing protein [Myxococcota bacterium]
MKRVHETSDRTVAQLLRGALESAGVSAIVEGEHLSAIRGEIPVGASAEYRVSIVDDEQLPRAALLIRQLLKDPAASPNQKPWVCAECGEHHEAHFVTCWKCGGEAELG